MKRPVRNDFGTAVTEAGVTLTFKPTNSILQFLQIGLRARTLHALAPFHRAVSDTRDQVAILRTTLLMKFKTWRGALTPE